MCKEAVCVKPRPGRVKRVNKAKYSCTERLTSIDTLRRRKSLPRKKNLDRLCRAGRDGGSVTSFSRSNWNADGDLIPESGGTAETMFVPLSPDSFCISMATCGPA